MSNEILVVAPTMFSPDYGGATRIIEHIKALSRMGILTKMYTYAVQGTLDEELSIEANELPIIPRFHQGMLLDRFYLDLALALRIILSNRSKPAFILSYNQEAAIISKVANLSRAPIIVDVQGILREEVASPSKHGALEKITYLCEKKMFSLPSVILTSNPFLAKLITNEFDVDSKKIEIVLDTADTNLFMPRSKDHPNVKRLRSLLGIKDNVRVVLYVGSFSSLQGTDILLKATKYVLDQERDLIFVLAGGRWSKNYEYYVQLAENLDISSQIKFIPGVNYVKTLPYLLNLADIGLAPKRFSLQSHGKLAVLMASGLPTVVFDSPINRLFLGSLGIYAKDVSAEAFGDAIISGLNETNDGVRMKLREKATKYFSLNRLVNDMQRIYDRVAV